MTRYLISFAAHAMDHIPDEDLPAVAEAAHEVAQEAMDAGVWVFGGGLEHEQAAVVSTDGTVSEGPYPDAIGGFWVVGVPSRDEALEWAGKTAVACRCAQEVREFMPDPAVGN
ncbi:MAG TPA: YciI family protein [Gaiellaceae bacterium]|nr:YciI family protein [Gaiellaceae bacterium]